MQSEGRWDIMFDAPCVYCLFVDIRAHTETDEEQQLALMRVG